MHSAPKSKLRFTDYYWVWANVAPIYEDDKLIGYISVRTKPSAKQVAEAVDVYQKIRKGQTSKWKIQDGKQEYESAYKIYKYRDFKFSINVTGRKMANA